MEIEFGKIVVMLIVAGICIIPFVLMNARKRKEEGGVLARMADFAAQKNCKITQHEFCGSITIGLDEPHNILVVAKKTKDNEFFQEVNLFEIESCNLIITHKTNKSKEKVVDTVALVFRSIQGSSNSTIQFYDSSKSMILIGELQLAEKWCAMINSRLQPTTIALV